jgi:DNA-binding PadR family transcriptional regulator
MRTLTKNQFLTLAVLLRFPMHAYAIRLEIVELTGHRVWPSKSTIEGVLDSLLANKLIEECYSNPHYWLKARRGSPYELTERGRHEIKKELAMYREITSIAQHRLKM